MRMRNSFASLLLAVALNACDSSNTSAPTEELEFPPPPHAFLDPSSYDCSHLGGVTAPSRPHPANCFADPSCDARLVAGHRMATPFAPENSLSALRAAILLGVDIVETDVRLTADGEVVLLHDGTVDRTLNGEGNVAELSLAAIQAMAMRQTADGGDFSCDRAPTLDDVFAVAKGNIVVELEVKNTDAGVKAAEYLRDNDLYAHAFLLCGASECEALRAAVPDVPIMSRPEAPDEVAAAIAYDPPPVLVHIDPSEGFLAKPILDSITGVGAKPFANAFFSADIDAVSDGRFEAYPELFDQGLGVVQTEVPHYALVGLGRLSLP